MVVGPCSVHDADAAVEYAQRLSARAAELKDDLCIAMRVYFEKPRTTIGWKGLINDPHLDGSRDVNVGLHMARRLLLEVLDLGLPIGCEFLDPITPQYISDVVAWGAIGARTTESQTHRQLASGLSMPVGFKNGTAGSIKLAVDAVRAAAAPHAFAGVDVSGTPAILLHRGQPRLPRHPPRRPRGAQLRRRHRRRGAGAASRRGPGGAPADRRLPRQQRQGPRPPAAGGRPRSPTRSPSGNRAIVGVMLESFLVAGRQDLDSDGPLVYGQSITDACMDWETTVLALDRLAGRGAKPTRRRLIGLDEGRRSRGGPDRRLDRARRALAPRRRGRRASIPTAGCSLAQRSSGRSSASAGSVAEAVEGAEIVFCAAPVRSLPDLAAEALAASADQTAVTDVGSVKREVLAALGGEGRFIGGHPLAGAETSGVEHARADLFEGARWYLTPAERTEGVLYDRVQRTIADLGARPQAIEAEAHDRLMATVSHLPHVLANVLVAQAAGALAEESERLPEVGPSFRDATRVAGANPAIWGDIFTGNREAVADEIDAVVEPPDARPRSCCAVASATRSPPGTQPPASAAASCSRRSSSGGPLHELRVRVPNRPGIVAELALALGRAGVNIEDMALYPAADMTLRRDLALIAGDDEAERAAELVRELGHDVTRGRALR